MTRPMWVKQSSAAIAALALVLMAPPGSAQQPPSGGPATLLDRPQVFRTAAATIRVTAVKGLVYPWALAFLPNGDILVTEQSRYTLAILSPAYLASHFADLENVLAEYLGLEKSQRRLLVALREDCTPRLGMRARLWLDMTDDNTLGTDVARLAYELRQRPEV